MNSGQLTVVRGEDRNLILRMIFRESQEPFDLVNWSFIKVEFKKSDRTTLIKDSTLKPPVQAQFTLEGVVYTADGAGIEGNDIILVFDGADDIATVVNDWNTANPTNTVSHDAVDDSVVPAIATIQLLGGRIAFRDVEVINETLSKISVHLDDADSLLLKSGPNQSFKVTVDKGQAPLGDRRIVLFDSKLNVIEDDF